MTRYRVVRRAAAACLAGPLLVLSAAPVLAAAPADAGSGTATVGVATDAWYAAGSACTQTPTGCLPAGQPPANPYPAKTLHVGVTAGQEESRTYLALDLGRLPAGVSITGGVLRLPVGSAGDGTRAPDTATLQACLATGAFKDSVDGSTEAPAKTDCKAATSVAKYVAAAGSSPELLTVDLAPFATAWSAGGSAGQGIALLPAADTTPASAWHIAISGHDRSVAATMRITATVSYAAGTRSLDNPPAFDQAAPPADTTGIGSGSASFAAPPLAPAASPQLPAAAPPAAPAVAPQAAPVAPAQQVQAQNVALVAGYAYPGVFLLPVLLAVAAGYLARALTRDLTPNPS
jgi:hypothetical protein